MQDERPAGLPKRVEVGAEIGRAIPALRRVLGRDHTLHVEVVESPIYLQIAPTHLHAILRSMVHSARRELPQDVTLFVTKHRVDGTIPVAGLADGWYVQLEVRGEATFTIFLPAAAEHPESSINTVH